MNLSNYLSVGAYQGPPIEGNIDKALDKTIEIATLADHQSIDILCLPECFLTGYFTTHSKASTYAIDFDSTEFKAILSALECVETTLILGMNERSNQSLFNTVAVIENGKLIGRYRKSYTYPPYDYYTCGNEYPVFEKKGTKYGVIVCYDSVFFEPSRILALNGATVLFCPSFNRISAHNRFLTKMHRRSHFISRAFENRSWFVVSDVIWDEKDEVCPGYSCILNHDGELMASSEPFCENLISYFIPLSHFNQIDHHRLMGREDLNREIANLRGLAEKT